MQPHSQNTNRFSASMAAFYNIFGLNRHAGLGLEFDRSERSPRSRVLLGVEWFKQSCHAVYDFNFAKLDYHF